MTREKLEENKGKFREILQEYGQKEKETRGEYVWVKAVADKISKLVEGSDPILIIIPDVRFPFEALWIREMGGYLIKIERFAGTTDTHPSETGVDAVHGVHYHLPNKGKLRDLERECKWVCDFIKQHYKI